jgi:hypothetical protein
MLIVVPAGAVLGAVAVILGPLADSCCPCAGSPETHTESCRWSDRRSINNAEALEITPPPVVSA